MAVVSAAGTSIAAPRVERGEQAHDTRWHGYAASIVGCAPVIPLLALVSIVVAYVAPFKVPKAVPLAGYPVLDGTLIALGIGILFTVSFRAMGFAGVRRANTRVYGELRERLADLTERLTRWSPPQVRITPRAPQRDAADATAYVYVYDIHNETAAALTDVALSFRMVNATPRLAGQAPAGWAESPQAGAPATLTLTADTLAAGAVQSLRLCAGGDAPMAVEVTISGSAAPVAGGAAPVAQLYATTTIDPAQATEGGPFVARGELLSSSVREAYAHRNYVEAELVPPGEGLRWVLATGYINLWSRLHRAEEALIDIEPGERVVRGALNDELRLMGSTIDNRDALLDELRAAVQSLSPAAAASLLQQPPHQLTTPPALPEPVARAALHQVNNTINEVRDANWDGLVRVRNHLNASILLTGLFTYILLAFVLSQPQRVDPKIVADVAALYLVGVIVGLFNQLFLDSQAGTAVEDYGLFLARLINIPLFSGLAAVFGVAITVMLPSAIAPAAAAKPGNIPLLIDVFNIARYPLDPVIAAVFGLTPNLLISRLSDQAAKLKANISSTEATNHT